MSLDTSAREPGVSYAAPGYALELEPREQVTPGGRSAGAGVTCGRMQVWKCGGGLNSVAVGALIVQGRIPKPDIALIVDTGREKRSTWTYMDAVLAPALDRVGVGLHRVMKDDWATVDLWSTKGTVLEIPAFTGQTGEKGKLSNYCSGEWKTRVAARWLREAMGVKVSRNWLGFALDEPRRWMPHAESEDVWLPLVNGAPMRRHDCARLVKQMGWPEAPRSNCWMCPNQSDDEWLETLRNRPDEFRRAVEMEREIREIDPHAYLHMQCVPLDQVDWTKPPELEFVRACNSGECFV